MKRLNLIFILILIINCSFDNKTGIWKDESSISIDTSKTKALENNINKRNYEDVFLENQVFNEEKESTKNLNLKNETTSLNKNWNQEFGSNYNNVLNLGDNNKNIISSKSPKLSRFANKKNYMVRNVIIHNDNIISYDHKGKIFIYSQENKKKIFEYNFYKKNFKNYKKEIFLIANEVKIYAADNLGYIYALDIGKKSLIWAKNFGIPFRSNMKIANDQIFVVNQENVLYSIDVNNGDKNWTFSSGLTLINSDFKNNLVLDNLSKNIFFLNTSGELYSINYLNQKINWLLNFKNPTLTGDNNLFSSRPVVLKNDNIYVSTEKVFLSYNNITSLKNWSLVLAPSLRPVVTNDYVYIFTQKNLLICIAVKNGEVLWSKNIFKQIKDKKFNKKVGLITSLTISNNMLNLYSRNGYLLSYDYKNGNLNFYNKISKKGIVSEIIHKDGKIFLVDKSNRLIKFN